LSQPRSKSLSLEQQCAELRRTLNLADTDAVLPGEVKLMDEYTLLVKLMDTPCWSS